MKILKKKKVSGLLECAKKMPELAHSIEGEEFDISDSEVVQWLIRQPEVQQYIFNRVANNGKIKLIAYDKECGIWKGLDYED